MYNVVDGRTMKTEITFIQFQLLIFLFPFISRFYNWVCVFEGRVCVLSYVVTAGWTTKKSLLKGWLREFVISGEDVLAAAW